MAKRKLTDTEMGICAKSITRIQDEILYNEYQIESLDRMIKTGLELEYKKKLRDVKETKREFNQEFNMAKEKLKVLKEQMRNGVEIKEKIEKEVKE